VLLDNLKCNVITLAVASVSSAAQPQPFLSAEKKQEARRTLNEERRMLSQKVSASSDKLSQ